MNVFQRECRDRIERVLARHDLILGFTKQPATDPAADGAVMFLRGDLAHGGRHYKLFVYADGAGANVGHNWYVLQSQDYPTTDALIETFCTFLDGCLEGQHPVTALQRARTGA